MITDMILLVLQGVCNIVLAPLSVLNIGINFIDKIPVIGDFISVIAYILPWTALLPLITIVVGSFIFRIAVALVKTIWDLLPVL